MAIVFDTASAPDLYIVLDPAQSSYTAREIYSRWKEWVLGDNANWPPAWRTIGGDDLGEGRTFPRAFFIRNDLGWRIRKPDGDGEYRIDGNLLAQNPAITTTAEPLGVFTPTLRINLENVSGFNTAKFWETVIADFDAGTAGYIITRLLRLAEADEEFTPSIARLRDKDTGDILLEKDVVGGSVTAVALTER